MKQFEISVYFSVGIGAFKDLLLVSHPRFSAKLKINYCVSTDVIFKYSIPILRMLRDNTFNLSPLPVVPDKL